MKIPDSVRIAGVEYKVKTVYGLNNGSSLAYGHIDFENCLIELSGDIGTSPQKRGQVLWHEILHGLFYRVNFHPEDEEEIVDLLAKGIYQVLQDNGERLFDIKEANDEVLGR